ncbi:MAG: hypothetical protein QW203_05730 [Thermoplasmatales archaeon]
MTDENEEGLIDEPPSTCFLGSTNVNSVFPETSLYSSQIGK